MILSESISLLMGNKEREMLVNWSNRKRIDANIPKKDVEQYSLLEINSHWYIHLTTRTGRKLFANFLKSLVDF